MIAHIDISQKIAYPFYSLLVRLNELGWRDHFHKGRQLKRLWLLGRWCFRSSLRNLQKRQVESNFSFVRSYWNCHWFHQIHWLFNGLKISLKWWNVWLTSFMIIRCFMLFNAFFSRRYLFWGHCHGAYITFMFDLNSGLRPLFCSCECLLFNFLKLAYFLLRKDRWRNTWLNHGDIGTGRCLTTDSGWRFQFWSTSTRRYLCCFEIATRSHLLLGAGRWPPFQGKCLSCCKLIGDVSIERHFFAQLYKILRECDTPRLHLLKLELKLLIF